MAHDVIRAWVVDDHAIFRRGLVTCLESEGIGIVAETAGFDPPPGQLIDVLLFDAERGGLAAALQVRSESPVSLIAMADSLDSPVVRDAVTGGAAGVVIRQDLDPVALVGAVRTVAAGNVALSGRVLQSVLRGADASDSCDGTALTGREIDVLRRLGDGDDTREIAAALSYSERTVKTLVHGIVTKLHCRNRSHAVAVAARRGLI